MLPSPATNKINICCVIRSKLSRKGEKDDDSLACTFTISRESPIVSSFVSVFQNFPKQCSRILRFSRFLENFYVAKICKTFDSLKNSYNLGFFNIFFLVFSFFFFLAYTDQPVNLIKRAWDERGFIMRLLLY